MFSLAGCIAVHCLPAPAASQHGARFPALAAWASSRIHGGFVDLDQVWSFIPPEVIFLART